jgi:hypothetical protein
MNLDDLLKVLEEDTKERTPYFSSTKTKFQTTGLKISCTEALAVIINNNSSAPNNGAILTMSTIIKAVMSPAAEAELGALFLNAKEAVFIRQILTEMSHPQPRTPIQTDNMTAEAVVNNRMQPKRLKSMDMRIHWLKCREAQEQFKIHWRPGKTNLADYFTKHHAPAHHVNIRS